MAVTIIKKDVEKAKPKAKVKVTNDNPIQEDLEEMARLKSEMAPFEANLEILHADFSEIEKRVLAWLEETGQAEEKYAYATTRGKIEFSAVPNKTEVTDKEKLVEVVEQEEEGLFARLANITLTDLKKYLSAKQIEKFTDTIRKGKRRCKITLAD